MSAYFKVLWCMGFQSLLEACVTDTGAIDFGRSGATGLAKQVWLVLPHSCIYIEKKHNTIG